ncbi:MAG: hypothetical protein RIT27_790 [Pseudomonadota bacterium]|jgi:hypothetical protein
MVFIFQLVSSKFHPTLYRYRIRNIIIEKLQFSVEKIQIENVKYENNKIAIDVSVRFISNPESEKENSKQFKIKEE